MPELETDRDPVEVLAAEFVERQRRAQKPTIEEYASKYPQWAERIRDLFPAVLAMERLKRQHIRSSSDDHLSRGIGKLEQLGDFRILTEIGRGGMGIVYEAEQLSLGRHVAVKVLPKQALLDAKQLQRFEREAQTAARLHHTNIVPVFGVGEQDGYHYFVMQYIRGVGLDKVLAELKRLRAAARPATGADEDQSELTGEQGERAQRSAKALLQGSYWQNVATIGHQVAEALDYAHGQSTLHRDIKPGNLLLDAQNVVWVADFGLAKATEQDDVSHTNDVIGTLRYMAPERFEGQADTRSDIYSLGLTLYEMLALKPAFNEPDRSSLIQQILHATPASPRKLDASIPSDLETIVLKAIAREPKHRYQNATALAADLECFLDDRPITARRTSAAERAWRWCRRNRAVAALTATALSLLILVAVVATVGLLRTRSALSGEQTQRHKAEATTQLAIEALDKIYEQFAPNRFAVATELTVEDPEGESYQVPIQPVLSSQAAVLLENMLAFYDRLAAQGIDQVEYRQKAAEANRRVGDIQQRLGQFDQAEAAYRRALDFYLDLRKGSSGETNVAAGTARVYNELGNVYGRMGQREKVVQSYTEALNILQATSAPVRDQSTVRFELARAHFYLGKAMGGPSRGGSGRAGGRRGGGRQPRRDPNGRRQRAERPPGESESTAAAPDRPRPSGPPTGQAIGGPPRGGIGQVDERSGSGRQPGRDPNGRRQRAERPPGESESTAAAPGRPRPPGPPERLRQMSASIQHLEQASQILEGLVKESPSVPDYRHLLARCYRHMFPMLVRADSKRAAAAETKATEIFEKLVHDFPDVPDYRYDLSETYARQGMVGLFRQQQDDAITQQRLRDALDIADKLVAEHPNVPDYAASLARIRFWVGVRLERSEDVEGARQAMQQATETQRALVDRHPKTLSHVLQLAWMQTQRARFLRDHGQLDEARAALDSSITRLNQNAKSSATQQRPLGFLLAGSYQMLADVLRRQDKKQLADEAAQQAQQQWEQLRPRGRGRPGRERRPERRPSREAGSQ